MEKEQKIYKCKLCGETDQTKLIKKYDKIRDKHYISNKCNACDKIRKAKDFQKKLVIRTANKVCKYCGTKDNLHLDPKGYACCYCNDCESKYQKDRDTARQQGCLQKYGVDNAMQDPEIYAHYVNKMLDEKNVTNIFQLPETIEAIQTKNMEKYGAKYASCLPEYAAKKTKTMLEKYGVENSMHVQEFADKAAATFFKNHGISNMQESPEMQRRSLLTRKENKWESFNEVLESRRLKPLFDKEFYITSTHETCRYKCLDCNKEFDFKGSNANVVFCECHSNKSRYEKEISRWISSLGITNIINNKNFTTKLPGITKPNFSRYEIDVYLPDQNIGIDFHGLYWHSNARIQPNYHRDKKLYFDALGVNYIQVFENEWRQQPDIVKSIIQNKLNLRINTPIAARKCDIREVPIVVAQSFLNQNHLQGSCAAEHKYGLYLKDDLVCLMTLGKRRFVTSDSNDDITKNIELIRFANKVNTNVIGGFDRLLKYSHERIQFTSVLSYIDKRYFDGKGYIKSGFTNIGESHPNYFYFRVGKNYLNLEGRQKYQKQNLYKILENFDQELTEEENMKLNGYLRIYDAGNIKMLKKY